MPDAGGTRSPVVFVPMEDRVAVLPRATAKVDIVRGLSTESSQAVAYNAARISPWLVACIKVCRLANLRTKYRHFRAGKD